MMTKRKYYLILRDLRYAELVPLLRDLAIAVNRHDTSDVKNALAHR
jgi:hypothetical protein